MWRLLNCDGNIWLNGAKCFFCETSLSITQLLKVEKNLTKVLKEFFSLSTGQLFIFPAINPKERHSFNAIKISEAFSCHRFHLICKWNDGLHLFLKYHYPSVLPSSTAIEKVKQQLLKGPVRRSVRARLIFNWISMASRARTFLIQCNRAGRPTHGHFPFGRQPLMATIWHSGVGGGEAQWKSNSWAKHKEKLCLLSAINTTAYPPNQ